MAVTLADDVDAVFEQVVETFQDGLYAFAVSLCGDLRRGEDIVQEAFIRAYRALKKYDPERRRTLALRPWLYTITLNVFRSGLRAGQREVLFAEPPEGADPAPGPESRALLAAEAERVLTSLARLPEMYRVPVVLKYVRDLSYAEMAQILEQPVGTVKSNVHRGIGLLRRDLLLEVS